MPGIPKENIQLEVTEDSIEVRAQQKVKKETKRKSMYSSNIRETQFYTKIPLPAKVKPDNACAIFKDGLLTVEIPRVKQIENKKTEKVKIK